MWKWSSVLSAKCFPECFFLNFCSVFLIKNMIKYLIKILKIMIYRYIYIKQHDIPVNHKLTIIIFLATPNPVIIKQHFCRFKKLTFIHNILSTFVKQTSNKNQRPEWLGDPDIKAEIKCEAEWLSALTLSWVLKQSGDNLFGCVYLLYWQE